MSTSFKSNIKVVIESNKFVTTYMGFSALPVEIKLKIFSMLSIGDQYYASLVWEEFTDEFWAAIPSADDFLDQLDQNYNCIDNLNNLEIASVLASAGYLDSLQTFYIEKLDLSSVNVNILNNLTKLVKDCLGFYEVNGLCFSIFENIKCKKLILQNMELHPLIKNIIVKELLHLKGVSGDVSGFLNKITCESLKLQKTMGLRSFESKSLAMMLKGRVRYLYFEPNSACDYSLLENYDGLGSCESMKLICCKFKMKEILNPWAKSVGWTVAEHGRGFLMQQKDVDAVH